MIFCSSSLSAGFLREMDEKIFLKLFRSDRIIFSRQFFFFFSKFISSRPLNLPRQKSVFMRSQKLLTLENPKCKMIEISLQMCLNYCTLLVVTFDRHRKYFDNFFLRIKFILHRIKQQYKFFSMILGSLLKTNVVPTRYQKL